MRIFPLVFTWFLASLIGCQPAPDRHTLRLKLLADTQQESNNRALKIQGKIIAGMKAQVEKNRNQPTDIAVLERAETIFVKANATVNALRNARAILLARTGDEKEVSELGSRQRVESKILVSQTAVSADSLYHRIHSFVKFLGPFASQPKTSGLQASNASLSTIQVLTSAKGYQEFYFKDATVAEALAVLAEQEAEILDLSEVALDAQLQLLRNNYDGFYRVYAYAVAESKTVRVGELYKADLLLVRSSDFSRTLKMTANGRSIGVSEDGRGRVEFVVPPPPDSGRATVESVWNGTISLPLYGHDTTFQVRVPYTIRK